ncbi:MAG: family 43 glycosylhydrolase, partial [Treponema sp.]|nr:family 43 glycosylhydrolase [Treponema sp.]
MIQKRPLVNDLYTADPSAHVFNDKIYIYPSHDEDIDVENNDNGDQYDMKDYHVYEMKDENTLPRDCGCVFTLDDVKWASKQLWAPDCVERNGKYYFFFPARDKTGMFRVGVALGDKPEGPFKPEDNYIQGTYSIDPCCFPDTDGKYYLTFGGLWGGQLDQYRNNTWSADNKEPREEEACTPKIALMKENMTELAEAPRDLVIVDENGKPLVGKDEDRRYFEDPWLFKKGDTYYFTYSTGTTHLLCYATS